jgi:hypothetical protein
MNLPEEGFLPSCSPVNFRDASPDEVRNCCGKLADFASLLLANTTQNEYY